MKYYIIAGEPSGDVHGANLISQISKLDLESEFRYWGGDKMSQQKEGLAKHIKETSFMGFVEVLGNIRKIKKLFSFAKEDIRAFAPDVVVLIDYPGFNLRLAKWLKNEGFKVTYYITPQVWAWKEKRAYLLEKYCEKIITVLPFEPLFFKEKNIEVEYVGHPLIDEINKHPKTEENHKHKGLSIAILPGSRKQEVVAMLSIMLKGALKLNPSLITIAKVRNVPQHIYSTIITEAQTPESLFKIEEDNTYNILRHADMAVVSSGTATLEAGLIGIPQVVCYKVNPISFRIARYLVKLKYISLVNLILDKNVVPELIQEDCNPAMISEKLHQVLKNKVNMMNDYSNLKKKLGTEGASRRAAMIIVESTSS